MSIHFTSILSLLLVAGMLLYAPTVHAVPLSCRVTPFSQTITASGSVTYNVGITGDALGSGIQLALGNLPRGVTGNFIELYPIVPPGEVSFVLQTERSAQVGNFSLTLLENVSGQTTGAPLCQYALVIQAPPPLPLETPYVKTDEAKVTELRTELSFDSRGADVAELQALLASDPSLYPEGLVTGWYGPLTTSAVRRFQRRMGIEPTGEVDEATQEKLDELRAQEVSFFKFKSYLILEVRGSSVVILQNVLKQQGFFPEDIDSTGYFGPITEAAVRGYQESQGIETTGTVGPITRAALNQD